MAVIALDLSGTSLASAAFDGTEPLLRDTVPLAGRAGRDVAALLVAQCLALRSRLRDTGTDAHAVGVAIPGVYHAERGTVWAPDLPGWDDYPLRDALQGALHDRLGAGPRVVVDGGRAACILGETWRGAAHGARDAVFLSVGRRIGAGILVDGRVLRGCGDVAGAVGWLALDRPYRDAYGGSGCFEHHASGPGLVTNARARLDADPGYAGPLRAVAPEALGPEQLFAAHLRGDPIAGRVLDDAIALWGMAAANLVALLNPETIVFGGSLFGPTARFLDRIRGEAARWAPPVAVRQARIVASTLGGDAGVYGAGRLALLALQDAAEPVHAPYSLGASSTTSVG